MQQMGTRCFSVYARKMLIDGYVIKLHYSDIKALKALGVSGKLPDPAKLRETTNGLLAKRTGCIPNTES